MSKSLQNIFDSRNKMNVQWLFRVYDDKNWTIVDVNCPDVLLMKSDDFTIKSTKISKSEEVVQLIDELYPNGANIYLKCKGYNLTDKEKGKIHELEEGFRNEWSPWIQKTNSKLEIKIRFKEVMIGN